MRDPSHHWPHYDNDSAVRVGVLLGSVPSALLGYFLLRATGQKPIP